MPKIVVTIDPGVTYEVIKRLPVNPAAGWATVPNITLAAGATASVASYYNGAARPFGTTKPLPAGVTLDPATGVLSAAAATAAATVTGLAFTAGADVPPPTPPALTGNWALDEATMTCLAWKPGKPWTHHWGDWKDKAGVICGTAPWASAPVAMVDWGAPALPIVFGNVVDLVREWIANGNRGVLVRGGSARVYTRLASANHRPFLSVNGIRCECTATGYLDGGTDYPVNNREYIGVYPAENDIEKACFQFDLSPIPAGATITTASMTLFAPKTETINVLYAFLLWPPA